MKKIEDLNVVYLAKYADAIYNMPQLSTPTERNYAHYHIAFGNVLKKIFPNLTATNDINYIIKNHNEIDYVVSLYNRFSIRNSEIFISSLCEYYHLAYLGAPPNIRAIAEDKHIAKTFSCALKIPTPKWQIISSNKELSDKEPFSGPFFVKPRFGASSRYIDESCICETWSQANIKTEFYLNQDIEVIIEEFIDGLFYSVPAFYSQDIKAAYPYILHSDKKGNVISYEQKRACEGGMRREFCIENDLTKKVVEYSKSLYKNMLPLDYARFDFLIENNTQQAYFLELNVCCNMAPQSGYVQTCIHNHLISNYENLIYEIIIQSLKRQKLI